MKPDIPNRGECPFGGTRIGGAIGSAPTLEHWWPNRLKVELLHRDPIEANPLGKDFDYAEAFKTLDLDAVKADIKAFLTTSVEWWPSDYGNYGPQMIRMAWHSAGTYRRADGRGGAGQAMQRFAPINSWWDNGNVDKSRRLLWPIKQKYGAALSWADLIVLAGNCSLEIMDFPTFGFAGGRVDAWEPDTAIYWGPEGWNGKKPGETAPGPMQGHPNQMVTRTLRWEGEPTDAHYDLENPLAASHQALIYVDPEGPGGNGVPLDSARDIRTTFSRMAMNDEETVALIAGGHAFGKSHGMVSPGKIGPAPEGAPIEAMGMGWQNPEGTGFAEYTMTNGIEGSWTPNPTKWDNDYLINLFKFEWEQTKSPAGAIQWKPKNPDAPTTPDAHREGVEHPLMMMTSDLALKEDPEYRKVCEKFLNDFDAFTDAFARAWFKLVHRDMGPKSRYLGPEVPDEDLLWQDPIPALDHEVVDEIDIASLKSQILGSGLTVSELVSVAWSAASTHRVSDKRGGANGGRIALEPQKSWDVNNPARVAKVLSTLEGLQKGFNDLNAGSKKISMADLVVLAGSAAIERAAKDAGVDVTVPFTPGRMDTTQENTDIEQFDWLKPVSDGFRNYHREDIVYNVPPEQMFLDRAALLSLTAPEWTALVGGLRVLDTNWDGSRHGVFTDRPGVLTNDFFTNLTSMSMEWRKTDEDGMSFTLNDRKSGAVMFTATRCDLIFGANAQLRQIAEVYAANDGHVRLVKDFVAAWTKVMMLDRFDLSSSSQG
ncbi:catalase/peroxidase HPI [Fulvimarina sp. 2208YS6-2-32]|uniref:Catalase-peroxidase n=1 Tax=Fulvimarina uroteuthidis TaxID=3098149 RepID=A0ABU5I2M1_9HYPH|nr:catalase/peroxidase HPI [Fulvimarina sp. 2208YS6-2-32]MDY8109618.1 catalase/peroxidase HPI [Fulvimarina sp. 2208YS6-2-32]